MDQQRLGGTIGPFRRSSTACRGSAPRYSRAGAGFAAQLPQKAGPAEHRTGLERTCNGSVQRSLRCSGVRMSIISRKDGRTSGLGSQHALISALCRQQPIATRTNHRHAHQAAAARKRHVSASRAQCRGQRTRGEVLGKQGGGGSTGWLPARPPAAQRACSYTQPPPPRLWACTPQNAPVKRPQKRSGAHPPSCTHSALVGLTSCQGRLPRPTPGAAWYNAQRPCTLGSVIL